MEDSIKFESLKDNSLNLIQFNTSKSAYAYNATHYAYPSIVLPLSIVTLIAFIANGSLVGYIFLHKLYHNFISSHFIAHLCLTNMIGLGILVPMFLINLWIGTNFWQDNDAVCRLQVNKILTLEK